MSGKMLNSRRLLAEDYEKPCVELANYLLGKILVRKLSPELILRGKIVETECYLGGEDKASHSYSDKQTKRNRPMYMEPGTTYVYKLYFKYHCLNISSKEPGAVVLIRALEPLRDDETDLDGTKYINLCNGPSKLCIAFDINVQNSNKINLGDLNCDSLWIEEDEKTIPFTVVNSSRIGIGSSAQEWVAAPLRYYVYNNKWVSKRDRQAERELFVKI